MDRMSYKYTECGLDNVVIHNMEVVEDDAGEMVYSIKNLVGLHKVIAHSIITRETGIQPNELRFLRTEIGFTQSELAKRVNKDVQTVGRWERGECPIDPNAELVVRMVSAERLEIDTKMSVEQLIEKCVPAAKLRPIEIDGSDPENYRLVA